QRGLQRLEPWRTPSTLLRLKQRHGFHCRGCAWPEGARSPSFARTAKPVAEETTKRMVTPEFVARHQSPSSRTAAVSAPSSLGGRPGHPVGGDAVAFLRDDSMNVYGRARRITC
ncbi:MAG TPA: hypothetical protein VFQ37_10435, partial [Mycobacterium sp.]|nr:hypothetical protein [Mycobacterium sp.]